MAPLPHHRVWATRSPVEPGQRCIPSVAFHRGRGPKRGAYPPLPGLAGSGPEIPGRPGRGRQYTGRGAFPGLPFFTARPGLRCPASSPGQSRKPRNSHLIRRPKGLGPPARLRSPLPAGRPVQAA